MPLRPNLLPRFLNIRDKSGVLVFLLMALPFLVMGQDAEVEPCGQLSLSCTKETITYRLQICDSLQENPLVLITDGHGKLLYYSQRGKNSTLLSGSLDLPSNTRAPYIVQVRHGRFSYKASTGRP